MVVFDERQIAIGNFTGGWFDTALDNSIGAEMESLTAFDLWDISDDAVDASARRTEVGWTRWLRAHITPSWSRTTSRIPQTVPLADTTPPSDSAYTPETNRIGRQ